MPTANLSKPIFIIENVIDTNIDDIDDYYSFSDN